MKLGQSQMEKGLVGTAKKFGPNLQALEVCVGGGVSAFKESMATFLFHSGNVSLWSGRGR